MKNTLIKRNKKEKINPEIIAMIKHQIIIFLIFVIICIVACALLFFGNIASRFIYCFSVVSLSLSAFISGYISGRKFKKNGIVVGIVNNIPVLVIFILTSLALNGFSVDYITLISVLIGILFSAVGGIVAVNTRVRAK